MRHFNGTLGRQASALLIISGLIAAAFAATLLTVGASPLDVATALFVGAFGSTDNLGETLIRVAPVGMIGLALIPCLRIGLFNIGAPGQIAMGGLFATMVGLHLANYPAAVALPIAMVAAAIGGALPAIACGWLRARWGVNEILSTLVLNMLARLLLDYLLTGPLKGARANIAQSDALPDNAVLPVMFEGTRAHLGITLLVVLVVLMVCVARTPIGYRLRLFGASRLLARQAGVHESRMMIGAMAFAGAVAGLAGWIQVAGVDHRLYASVADPIGQTGLFAALLGGLSPLGVMISSIAFAALLRGGDYLQVGAGISPELVSVLVGLVLLGIAGRYTALQQRRAA